MAAVSGLDPSILADPTYQVQMMRAQRQMALAQALRQQSLQDTPGNGGSVSWTQGLARLADALSSSIGERRAEKNMIGANQGYAAGLARMFGAGQPPQAPQTAQGGQPPDSAMPTPQMPAQPPQQAASFVAGQPPSAGQPDPLAPLPNAPPQAAPQQPPASSPAPAGGAFRGPWSLTGNPQQDMGAYLMNQDEYGKALIGNLAKSAAPTDTEVLMAHAKQLAAQGDYQGAAMLANQAQKAGYIEPINVRNNGVALDPVTHQVIFRNPNVGPNQGVDFDAHGQPTRIYNIPGGLEATAAQAGAQAGAQAAAKAPYDVVQTYNPQTGQMEMRPKSDVTGSASSGGSLNQHYGVGGAQSGGPGHFAAAPPIGATAAANTYGQGSAQGALETQNSAEGSQIRVQAYREMQNLLHGGLSTGPTQARMQELAEEHGLSFLAKDNAFVFNKDAALAVAQQAKALGLNSSDARFEAVARATPNMKMTPQALAQVIPVRIGMEYASQAEATANANWIAQHGPQTNPQFKNFWRQNYDPRMFTAYAQGGPQALAKAPANLRQQWLSEYRNLKSMGFSFQQLAQ